MQLSFNYSAMRSKQRTNPEFTFIDLFAGIGGFRLALESLGGGCLFTSEWDKHSQRTYKAWFDEDEVAGDITQLNIESDIPIHDVLAAGFPCQPFSLAGVSKKNSLGREHGFRDRTQGTLFFHIAEILDRKRPKIAILENVKNLKSHDSGRTFEEIIRTLTELDYNVFHKIIDAKHWVPQHRERILIIAMDKKYFGHDVKFCFPNPPDKVQRTLEEILTAEVEDKYTLSDKLWDYLQKYAAKHQAKGNGFGFGLVAKDGISRTISARYHKDGSEILIPQEGKNPRRLTPHEALRLMGFDEILDDRGKDIVVSDTQAYRQFGNAVVPAVVRYAAQEPIRLLLQAKKKKRIDMEHPTEERATLVISALERASRAIVTSEN
jgi:DNA (cytosine-5)-methyltransferase 1